MGNFNLPSFLLWIATGGGAAAIVSWLCERWGWYQAQAPERKSWLMLLMTAGGAIGAKLLIDYLPPNIIDAAAPYVAIIVSIVGAWATSQGVHKLQKNAAKEFPPGTNEEPTNTAHVDIDGNVSRSNVITAGRDIKR